MDIKKLGLLLILLMSTLNIYGQNRTLVISGGGARGAWGGGVVQYLVEKQGLEYDMVIGNSTGSLMAPFVAINDFDNLKRVYTGVRQKSIFSVNPFKIKTNGDEVEVKLKYWKAISRLLFGKKTLGETKNLRKLIYEEYDTEKYEQILSDGIPFLITAVNFTNSEPYYFGSTQPEFDSRTIQCDGLDGKALKTCIAEKDFSRKKMLDWIWRSANQPLFMTLDCTKGKVTDFDGSFVEGENDWVDGGVRENIPLWRGIKHVVDNNPNCDDSPVIDVIINTVKDIQLEPFNKKTILNSLFRTIGILTYDVRDNDISIPSRIQEVYQMEAVDFNDSGDDGNFIEVNLYFMPEDVYAVHPWDLYFDETGMTRLWAEGEAFNVAPVKMKISKEVAHLLVAEGIIE